MRARYRDAVAPTVRRAGADDDAAVRARLGEQAEAALGGLVAADLAHPSETSAAWFADDAYGRVVPGPRAGTWIVAMQAGDATSRAALLGAAAAHAAVHGGGRITWWVAGATADDDQAAHLARYERAREQHQMRVTLPLTVPTPPLPPGVTLRDIDPDHDARDWVAVNNAAFADHAEQGGWTVATFRARAAEPWFDPALFLVAVDAEGMLGFNWLKVHREETPPAGEIYAVGVAPRAQGKRLGLVLAVAGLDRLAQHGLTRALLYVAADNTAAIKLYEKLGFTTARTDRAYERLAAPA
jgi:mycothiol synthase